MPFRAGALFLRAKRRLTARALESINALSGWCSISTTKEDIQGLAEKSGINALSGWGSISTRLMIRWYQQRTRNVSMPSRAGALFLLKPFEIDGVESWGINALSGWGSISTVPLRKPRFYAVSGACFCRYLSEYSDNDHFSCMLTIWTYLIATSYLGLF